MKKNRPNFRIIERPTNEIPEKYPEFKRLYLKQLDMLKREIRDKLGITQTEVNSLTKRVKDETGLERHRKGKKIILRPVTPKKMKSEGRFYQKEYEPIYDGFKEDYLYTRMPKEELMEKYDLKNMYQFKRLRELVEDRTGWSRDNLHTIYNKVTGERRRIKKL